jgi:hypothetical protein
MSGWAQEGEFYLNISWELRVETEDVVGPPCVASCSMLCPSPAAMHFPFSFFFYS